MNILFVSEFFPPVNFGGAEWSSYYLARGLSQKKGFNVTVLTPDYKLKHQERQESFKIIRFPYYLRIKKNDQIPSNFHFINPLWLIIMAFNIYKVSKELNVQIIHIQGKYSLVPARLASIFLKTKILMTVRDYILLCNYGLCLQKQNKACNLIQYYMYDFKRYINEYQSDKKIKTIFINLIYSLYGRTVSTYLRIFSQGLTVVVLSKKQKEIYANNGYKKVFVIGNSIIINNILPRTKKENIVVYAGRLTPGKGVNLLINVIQEFLIKYPSFKFVFCGDGFYKDKINKLAQIKKNIKLFTSLDHAKLLQLIAKSKLTVVPSVWQEPFGRVALESLSQGTPTVVSNRGGLPEIIKNERWGYVVEPTEKKVLEGIIKGLKNNKRLTKYIKKDYGIIRKIFGSDIIDEYISIYKKLTL